MKSFLKTFDFLVRSKFSFLQYNYFYNCKTNNEFVLEFCCNFSLDLLSYRYIFKLSCFKTQQTTMRLMMFQFRLFVFLTFVIIWALNCLYIRLHNLFKCRKETPSWSFVTSISKKDTCFLWQHNFFNNI